MNTNDRLSALELACEVPDLKNHGPNMGGMSRNLRSGRTPFPVDAARLLLDGQGSIIWDVESPQDGVGAFNNIYEYAAAEIYAPGGTSRQRMEAAQDYGTKIRQGVASLADWYFATWGLTLYRCKGVKGALITVITVRPDLELATGETAGENQRERDIKAVTGAARAAVRRSGSQIGEVEKLRAAFNSAVAAPLPNPHLS